MKILFDHQIFYLQDFGGISRYFSELISRFNNDGLTTELSILHSNNECLKHLPGIENKVKPKSKPVDPYKSFLGGAEFRGKGFLYRAKNKFLPAPITKDEYQENKLNSIAKIKEGNFDVFHPTYYDDYFLDHINNKPFVLTVHDLIHQIFPEYYMYDMVDKNKRLLQNAAKIIAVSESTKKDLISVFDIAEEKVDVIYHGNSLDENSATEAISSFHLPGKYILFVGNRIFYKNFLFFIQAASTILEEYPDLNIVCTGPAFNENELYFFNRNGLTDKIHHVFANDSELAHLYKNAVLFVFPTMYEGFGLPILEAFSCGCPVVCSNTSSLPEVAEEAAIYFGPKDISSLIDALRLVIDDEALRTELKQKGYRQIKKFSWQNTAEKTREIYRSVLETRLMENRAEALHLND